MEGLCWIACKDGEKCGNPVVVKNDCCSKHLVISAGHEGGFIPGVLCEDKKQAQIPWGGVAHEKNEYYVLSNKGDCELVWEKCSKGKVPLGALRGGKSEDNEELFIGRIEIDSTVISGKIHPSHKTCYIPHEGKEKGFEEYEALCIKTLTIPVKE